MELFGLGEGGIVGSCALDRLDQAARFGRVQPAGMLVEIGLVARHRVELGGAGPISGFLLGQFFGARGSICGGLLAGLDDRPGFLGMQALGPVCEIVFIAGNRVTLQGTRPVSLVICIDRGLGVLGMAAFGEKLEILAIGLQRVCLQRADPGLIVGEGVGRRFDIHHLAGGIRRDRIITLGKQDNGVERQPDASAKHAHQNRAEHHVAAPGRALVLSGET